MRRARQQRYSSSRVRGSAMKGRRKSKATKWAMKLQFQREAYRLMATRSAKVSNRFLNAVLQLDSSSEPTSRLAGASSKHHRSQNPDLPALLSLVVDLVCRAGQLLVAKWERVDGPRGQGDKAVVDVEIELLLRRQLLDLCIAATSGPHPDTTPMALGGRPQRWRE